MFVPEYSITQKTLKNISLIEYGKAVIENTVILQNWEKQLKNQKLIDQTYALLQLEGFSFDHDTVKKSLDGLASNSPKEITNIKSALQPATQNIHFRDLEEADLKQIYKTLSGKQTYRSNASQNKTPPAEILAEMVELFDWLNGIDARDGHAVVISAVAAARLTQIWPFETYNIAISNILGEQVLRSFNFSVKDFVAISGYFNRDKKTYFNLIKALSVAENDFTKWIEFYSEALSVQVASVQDKVKLLAKDTKVAKASGRMRLSARQERIVEYLQDYGILQNKDFPRLFPDKSEDSILRDLKVLVDLGIVVKAGSTKSSRYELK